MRRALPKRLKYQELFNNLSMQMRESTVNLDVQFNLGVDEPERAC